VEVENASWHSVSLGRSFRHPVWKRDNPGLNLDSETMGVTLEGCLLIKRVTDVCEASDTDPTRLSQAKAVASVLGCCIVLGSIDPQIVTAIIPVNAQEGRI